MDAAQLKQQMTALKTKARKARLAGELVVARQFASGAARLWRKVRKLTPRVAKKAEA